jgi:hypothetical protein
MKYNTYLRKIILKNGVINVSVHLFINSYRTKRSNSKVEYELKKKKNLAIYMLPLDQNWRLTAQALHLHWIL